VLLIIGVVLQLTGSQFGVGLTGLGGIFIVIAVLTNLIAQSRDRDD
jgi:drug/metabolite transporter superfamily protein YnfA